MPGQFSLANLNSPTSHQLHQYLLAAGWKEGDDPQFSETNLEFTELDRLEFKHLLSQFLGPDLSWMQPPTWCLDEDNWQSVLSDLAQHQEQYAWILKPSLLNNGQDIHLFANLAEVVEHYSHTNRLGGPHVLQAYIDPPHLLQGPEFGHKYSLRLFVVMTNSAAYLYPHGYFNVALKPYDLSHLKSKLGHITNEHLQPGVYNVVQVPTTQYPIFQRFWPQIINIFQEVSRKFLNEINLVDNKIGFLGMDLMLDANERVWLLEFNHGPCFPRDDSHPLYIPIYQNFWQAVVDEIISPHFLGRASKSKTFLSIQTQSALIY
jgi:tubulin--tyrosine ligase